MTTYRIKCVPDDGGKPWYFKATYEDRGLAEAVAERAKTVISGVRYVVEEDPASEGSAS